MSIQVISNNPTETVEAEKAEAVVTEEVKETKSAPEAKASDETTEESETSEDTEAESEESESDDESNSEDASNRPKKKGGFVKRIDKLTKRLSQKDQEIEHWKREALKGQVAPEKPETAAVQDKATPEGKPKAEDFDSHDDYVEAVADWKYEQRRAKETAEAAETQAKTEYQKARDAHQTRVNEFMKETSDYKDVLTEYIEEHGDFKFSAPVEDLILQSDLGPAVIYELAKNPAELERINSLPPLMAAREFGKLELRIAKDGESQQKTSTEIKKTKAPPPIKPVGSGPSGAKKTIFEAKDQAEYEAIRRSERKSAWGA